MIFNLLLQLLGESLVNETYSIVFLLVDDLGINLRYFYLSMSKQLACCIDVCTKSEHHCTEGMSATVEGDRLGYTCLVKPWLKVELCVDLNRYSFKDKVIVSLVTSLSLASIAWLSLTMECRKVASS